MKRQLVSALTIVSMTLSPLAALGAGVEGSQPPKNKCGKQMKPFLNELWKGDKRADLKKEFQNYYGTPEAERTMTDREFCDAIKEAYDTDAKFCSSGDCRAQGREKPDLRQNSQDIVDHAREKQFRPESHGPPVVSQPPPPRGGGAFVGGGDGGGMMMMAMMMMMMSMGGNNQRPPMFPPPRGGPFGRPPPFMPANRPPQFMPFQRPYQSYQAPFTSALGGGYGYSAPSMYNGAQFYNGGAYGGGNYFANPGPAPAIINPITGARTYSVLGN